MAPPKGSRRGQSALSQVSTVSPNATPARSTTKSNKNTKIVILKLLPDVLSQFPHDAPTLVEPLAKAVTTTSDSVSSSSSAVSAKKKAGKEFTPLAKPGDSDEAQSPDKSMAQAEEEKLVKAGTKREAEQPLSEDGKPKPKAPLRKRPKVGENGRLDGRTSAAKAAGFVAGAHKLGPKANQGAINEKLRALDRTSKPCRKWVKTGFKIKSFTGRAWEMPTWNSGQTRFFGSEGASQANSNDLSKEENSSNLGSDNSPVVGAPDVASSPAVAAAA